MKIRILIYALSLLPVCGSAARVDTLRVKSPSMRKEVDVVAVVPQQAIDGQKVPVIYLLHGHGGNHMTWINMKPELKEIADREGVMFVTPDGKDSWYWDSPQNPDFRYETFLSSELVDYIDSNYPTYATAAGRAITGLSMGGHGALWNGIRHPQVFANAGSTSGGVDIRPFPDSWGMKKYIGEQKSNKSVWDNHTVTTLADTLTNGTIGLIIDCGYEDFFFEVNERLHKKLMERGVEHDYLVRPGAHNGSYWKNSIDYQILFFTRRFQAKLR